MFKSYAHSITKTITQFLKAKNIFYEALNTIPRKYRCQPGCEKSVLTYKGTDIYFRETSKAERTRQGTVDDIIIYSCRWFGFEVDIKFKTIGCAHICTKLNTLILSYRVY